MCKAILLVSYLSYGLLLGNEDASLGFHSFNDRKRESGDRMLLKAGALLLTAPYSLQS